MIVFPLKPLEDGYSVALNLGVLQNEVDGGLPRSRRGNYGGPSMVTLQWANDRAQQDVFMGALRNWARSGGAPFLIGLPIDTAALDVYTATFVKDSLRLVSRKGLVTTMAASLYVLPLAKYSDAATDLDGIRAILIGQYGTAEMAEYALGLLKKLMTEDMPHE